MKMILRGFIFLFLGCWAAVSGSSGTPGQLVTIGILPFLDDSGTQAPFPFLERIGQEFKLHLTRDYKDVLGRPISGGSLEGLAALSVDELAALGRQQGVKWVMRGGLLAAVSDKTGGDLICRLSLYCDLIDTESQVVSSFRAEGAATESGSTLDDALRWSAYAWDDPGIATTALARALDDALASLAGQVHASTVSIPSQVADEEVVPGEAAPSSAVPPSDSTQMDQDLQQLIAEAESLISGGAAASLGDITPLQQMLESLLASLDTKLGLLEQAEDTTAVDQQIAQQKEDLRNLVGDYTEQLAAAQAQPGYDEAAVGAETDLETKLKEILEKALADLLNIQEIQALPGSEGEGGQGDYVTGDVAGDEYEVTEEEMSDVYGVVTDEAGNPIEGATVVDSETGAAGVTDGSGSYSITGIPGGHVTNIQVIQAGKPVAGGKLVVPSGKPGIADWIVRPGGGGSSSSSSRVLPSTMIARSAKDGSSTGTIQGVVQNDQGQPVSHALVTVKDVGVVRTNSAGRYSFANVPPGAYDVTVQQPGAGAQAQRIQVKGRQMAQLRPVSAAKTPLPGVGNRNRAFVRGGDALIKGRVTDDKGKPLSRAKLTVFYPGGALKVFSDQHGGYEFRSLKQDTYRLLASKAGYKESSATVNLKKNKRASQNFRLKPAASPAVQRAVASQSRKQAAAVSLAKSGTATKTTATSTSKAKTDASKKSTATATTTTTTTGVKAATTQAAGTKTAGALSRSSVASAAAKASVQGTVIDAKSGKAVAGASVVLKGKPGAKTDASGRFRFSDLAAGAYSVTVKKTGYKDASASFTAKVDATASVRIRLTPLAVIKTAPVAIRKAGRPRV
jgi:protocatechuate 3,4-dioxygenase beta subunit